MAGNGATPFEFALPLDKSKAKEPVAVDQKSPTEAPKFTDSTPEGIGKQVSTEFKTERSKNAYARELAEGYMKDFDKFSPEFRAKYGKNGKPDMPKILEFYGLTPHLGNQFTPDGQVKEAPSPAENIAPGSGKIPERPADAMTGQQFMEAMNKLGEMNSKENQLRMEQAILAQIEAGNIPSFCRPENMKPVTMAANGIQVTYKTTPDYLAIGSNTNFVRVPMTPLLAQTLAKKYGWGLPTDEMTKSTYAAADYKLKGIGYVTANPDRFQKGSPEWIAEKNKLAQQNADMQRNGWILRHNEDIDTQLGPLRYTGLITGQAMVAGHKKDVIISKYAIDHPGKLDFRGLYINGKPVQTNPAHEDSYRDYSHGFRPVDGMVSIVDTKTGQTYTKPYYEALKDPAVAKVLNGAEGVINAHVAYQDRRTDKKAA